MAILIWLAVLIGAILFVLRLARGESHDGTFSERLYERSNPRQEPPRVRRVGGTMPSFTPQSTEGRPKRPHHADGDIPEVEQTMENPVYVINGTVVEVRSLRTPQSGAPQQRAGETRRPDGAAASGTPAPGAAASASSPSGDRR
ncbi:hypothetical protein [Bifidobacterium moraviense]|uniref:hypothetical protein n=1 Tax=Bifidobacterium moraviense TaxID=2675323 RepID=UPI00145DF020|nr:hypothetical protein [Bifidobacterium sp. DSM 109958]